MDNMVSASARSTEVQQSVWLFCWNSFLWFVKDFEFAALGYMHSGHSTFIFIINRVAHTWGNNSRFWGEQWVTDLMWLEQVVNIILDVTEVEWGLSLRNKSIKGPLSADVCSFLWTTGSNVRRHPGARPCDLCCLFCDFHRMFRWLVGKY